MMRLVDVQIIPPLVVCFCRGPDRCNSNRPDAMLPQRACRTGRLGPDQRSDIPFFWFQNVSAGLRVIDAARAAPETARRSSRSTPAGAAIAGAGGHGLGSAVLPPRCATAARVLSPIKH